MKNKIDRFFRKNLIDLIPYRSAREEYANQGVKMILLDANENPFTSSSNRYPDPMQTKLKNRIANWKNINENQIYLSNGSDESISQLIMAFCEPGIDNIIILPPTFGMYKVSAHVHGIKVIEVPLDSSFQIDAQLVLEKSNKNSKIIFIPTPNNPTGNSFNLKSIIKIIKNFSGLVVIDEAYVEFSNSPSFIDSIKKNSNLIVCQTFSKGQGMAGARLGMTFANSELIAYMNKIKAPYNLNSLTQSAALLRLEEQNLIKKQAKIILKERKRIEKALRKISFIITVYKSDANFLLIKVDDSNLRYQQLIDNGIVVRNSSKNLNCENTLRITVGLSEENTRLIDVLNNIDRK